jgi:flavin reductase (DIM6/NTAB) family NADH-FMN oxidoreductase RutF
MSHSAVDDVGATAPDEWVAIPKHLLVRPLFPHPVCVILTRNCGDAALEGVVGEKHRRESEIQFGAQLSPADSVESRLAADAESLVDCTRGWNAAVVSWLGPVDNHDTFTMTMHPGRHSVSNILQDLHKPFALCIAVEGTQDLLRTIAAPKKTPEELVDKVTAREIPLRCLECTRVHTCTRATAAVASMAADGVTYHLGDPPKKRSRAPILHLPILEGSPVQLVCQVQCILAGPSPVEGVVEVDEASHVSSFGHYIFLCTILQGHIRRPYWLSGKTITTPVGYPPFLTFLGSDTFATIHPQHI